MAATCSSFVGSRSASFRAAAGIRSGRPAPRGLCIGNARKGIHPEWHDSAPVFCNGVEVMTVGGTKAEYNVDVYSGNHPFYLVRRRGGGATIGGAAVAAALLLLQLLLCCRRAGAEGAASARQAVPGRQAAGGRPARPRRHPAPARVGHQSAAAVTASMWRRSAAAAAAAACANQRPAAAAGGGGPARQLAVLPASLPTATAWQRQHASTLATRPQHSSALTPTAAAACCLLSACVSASLPAHRARTPSWCRTLASWTNSRSALAAWRS